MKIFAIYTKLALTQKPEWLDEFRQKFHKPWEYHITLKQPCYVANEKVEELKTIVTRFFAELETPSDKINLTLNQIKVDKTEDGTVIMVNAQNPEQITELQKNLCARLAEYTDYVSPITQTYEQNFNPHITIGDNLTDEHYQEALTYLKDGCACEGEITQIVLSIVKDTSLEEANNTANQTIFHL